MGHDSQGLGYGDGKEHARYGSVAFSMAVEGRSAVEWPGAAGDEAGADRD